MCVDVRAIKRIRNRDDIRFAILMAADPANDLAAEHLVNLFIR